MSKKIKYLVIVLVMAIIVFAIEKVGINKSVAKNNIQIEKSVNTEQAQNINNQQTQSNTASEKNTQNLEENNEEIDQNLSQKINIKYVDIPISEVKIPILMYHSISAQDPGNSLLVPPEQFEAEVAFLKESGYNTITLGQAVEALKTGHIPEKPVILSFDDGYVDNYTDAFNILKKYDMIGTFFIITDNTDGGGYMSLDMLREMKEAGMDLQNHTAHHLDLSILSYDDQKESIKSGQDFLRDKIGVDSEFVCYPSGKYNDNTIQVLKDLNMQGAVTTEFGTATANDGVYTLKRIRIAPMTMESFQSIFS